MRKTRTQYINIFISWIRQIGIVISKNIGPPLFLRVDLANVRHFGRLIPSFRYVILRRVLVISHFNKKKKDYKFAKYYLVLRAPSIDISYCCFVCFFPVGSPSVVSYWMWKKEEALFSQATNRWIWSNHGREIILYWISCLGYKFSLRMNRSRQEWAFVYLAHKKDNSRLF